MTILILLLAVSLFITVWGTLLASGSSSFLWFHDTFLDRSKRGRNAPWRQKVNSLEYRLLGVVFVVMGLFFAVISVTGLLAGGN